MGGVFWLRDRSDKEEICFLFVFVYYLSSMCVLVCLLVCKYAHGIGAVRGQSWGSGHGFHLCLEAGPLFFFFHCFPLHSLCQASWPMAFWGLLCLSSHYECCKGRHALPCWLCLCWGIPSEVLMLGQQGPTEPSSQPKKEI